MQTPDPSPPRKPTKRKPSTCPCGKPARPGQATCRQCATQYARRNRRRLARREHALLAVAKAAHTLLLEWSPEALEALRLADEAMKPFGRKLKTRKKCEPAQPAQEKVPACGRD